MAAKKTKQESNLIKSSQQIPDQADAANRSEVDLMLDLVDSINGVIGGIY